VAVINRHKEKGIRTDISLENFSPQKKAHVIVLNAPEVTTANDFDNPENVTLKEKEIPIAGKTFTYTFPAHSVTVILLKNKK
jgi:alpha-N-arabinofuranosidase